MAADASRVSAVEESVSSRRLRCAIYTRKSTEEGLEQEFNSCRGAARVRGSLCEKPAAGRIDIYPEVL